MHIDRRLNSKVTTADRYPDGYDWAEPPASREWARRLSARNLWRAATARPSALVMPVPLVKLRQALTLNARTLPVFAAIAEFGILTAVTFEAGAVYHYAMFNHLPWPVFYFVAVLALVGGFVLQCNLARDHSIKRLPDAREQLRSVFKHWNIAFSVFVVALFMIQATDFYSRGSIISQYVAGLSAAIFLRLAMSRIVDHWLTRGVIRGRKVVAVGIADNIKAFLERVRQDGPGADIVDTIVIAAETSDDDGEVLRRLQTLARRMQIDEIVIALPWRQHERIRALVEWMSIIPATIHLAPDPSWIWIREPVLARVGRTHTLRLSRAPLTQKDRGLKRIFDIVVASGLLLISAPLLVLIAIAIKLDSSGPVLFLQRRNGFNQREFRVFKFRTMTTLDDGDVVRQAQINDSRVTRVGRILRRTNLDEVPQLLNVIIGDMSLVGPRPHAVAHNNKYEERIRLYARRHNVKPGITGWAQVNGLRGETSTIDKMVRRVEHDLYYIDHWSVLFDIKIMLMTLFSPRSYRNAY
jgi:Undecaprenyl-phosphate glucose phosphotransferase